MAEPHSYREQSNGAPKARSSVGLLQDFEIIQHLVDAGTAVPWEIDRNTLQFTYIGHQAAVLLDTRIENLYLSNYWKDHVHPQDLDGAIHFIQNRSNASDIHTFEYRMVTDQGRVVWLRNTARALADEHGNTCVCGLMFDCTPQMHAIEQLTMRKAMCETMFNITRDAVLFLDTHKQITAANPAAAQLFGYNANDLLGRTVESFWAQSYDHCQINDERIANNKQGKRLEQKEVLFRKQDGTNFWGKSIRATISNKTSLTQGYVTLVHDISALVHAENNIVAAEQELTTILNSLQDVYYRADLDGTILKVSPSLVKVMGYTPEEVLGTNLADYYINPRDRVEFLRYLENQGGVVENYEGRLRRKDNSTIWVATNAHYVLDGSGNVIGVEGTSRDISRLKEAEDLRSRFGRILDHSSNEIYVFSTDDLRFVQVNRGARINLGYSHKELEQLTPVDISPEFDKENFQQLLHPLRSGESEQLVFKTTHLRKDGSDYPVEVRLQHSQQESPPVFLALVQDISERIGNEKRLQYLAHHDALTALPNRVLFMDRLEQCIGRAKRHNKSLAVLFLDLDRFKVINDTLGHDVGDRALQALAERLKSCICTGDTVARLGGDEFAIVLEDIQSSDDVAPTAKKILQVLSRSFLLDDTELFITTSIGISLYPNDGTDSQTLLKHADVAMYRAKDDGRDRYQFYSSEMSAKALEKLVLETSLRKALEREEFVVHYQPQMDLKRNRIVGVEALLRWEHPSIGIIPPEQFIPMLEETGLIVPVGEWVLDTACRQNKEWNKKDSRPLRVSVNLSARQTSVSTFVTSVENALKRTQMDPRLLELEITESILLHNIKSTVHAMEQISELGVRFAIDDFGTGYSSLSYLKRFPIDTLKIDRSFIRDLHQDPDDATLVEAIIAMSLALNLNVVAEGVETVEQAKFLTAHFCHVAQGHLLSQPVPARKISDLLTSGLKLKETGLDTASIF